jgi:hypothetical protein
VSVRTPSSRATPSSICRTVPTAVRSFSSEVAHRSIDTDHLLRLLPVVCRHICHGLGPCPGARCLREHICSNGVLQISNTTAVLPPAPLRLPLLVLSFTSLKFCSLKLLKFCSLKLLDFIQFYGGVKVTVSIDLFLFLVDYCFAVSPTPARWILHRGTARPGLLTTCSMKSPCRKWSDHSAPCISKGGITVISGIAASATISAQFLLLSVLCAVSGCLPAECF